MPNSKLFSLGGMDKVDMETGEAIPVEGGGFRMLPGPPGTCEWCHVKHEHDEPHNRDSLSYQIKFNAIKGRAPTWTDAMAHCSPEVQKRWREGLVKMMKEHKLEIPEDLL